MNSVVLIAALAIGAVLFSTTAMKNGGGGSGSDVVLDPNLDADGDGVIEANELVTVAKPAQLNNDLDLDGDGIVEDHELDENFFARHRVSLLCASTSVIILFAVLYMQKKQAEEKAVADAKAAKEREAKLEADAKQAKLDAKQAKLEADAKQAKLEAAAENAAAEKAAADSRQQLLDDWAAAGAAGFRNQPRRKEKDQWDALTKYDLERAHVQKYRAATPADVRIGKRRDWILPGMELERAPSGQYQKSPLSTRAEKKFNRLDVDGNGSLDEEEVLQLAKWTVENLHPGQAITEDQIQAEAKNIMEQCDANGDQLIDKAEFSAYYEEKAAAIQALPRPKHGQ